MTVLPGDGDPIGGGGLRDNEVGASDYTVWADNFNIDWFAWPSFELYTSDAILLDSIGGSESAERTPLWEAHAEKFFDWGEGEINQLGLDGFLAELEAWLMPTV